MPELPEVEHARRSFERWLWHKRIARVALPKTRVLRGSSVAALRALAGHRVEEVRRHGKWLEVSFDRGLALALHLGMTGKLVREQPGREVRWSRARFVTDDGTVVHFQDQRLFGRLAAGPRDALEQALQLDRLGPDAWDAPLSADQLGARLSERKRALKEALLDQTVVAGLGNIQATEALWKARLHPARPASSLAPAELRALVKAIHWTLARTFRTIDGDEITYLEEGGENVFRVYGRAGKPCPRCGTTLEARRLGGRASVFCPQCQPGG